MSVEGGAEFVERDRVCASSRHMAVAAAILEAWERGNVSYVFVA